MKKIIEKIEGEKEVVKEVMVDIVRAIDEGFFSTNNSEKVLDGVLSDISKGEKRLTEMNYNEKFYLFMTCWYRKKIKNHLSNKSCYAKEKLDTWEESMKDLLESEAFKFVKKMEYCENISVGLVASRLVGERIYVGNFGLRKNCIVVSISDFKNGFDLLVKSTRLS